MSDISEGAQNTPQVPIPPQAQPKVQPEYVNIQDVALNPFGRGLESVISYLSLLSDEEYTDHTLQVKNFIHEVAVMYDNLRRTQEHNILTSATCALRFAVENKSKVNKKRLWPTVTATARLSSAVAAAKLVTVVMFLNVGKFLEPAKLSGTVVLEGGWFSSTKMLDSVSVSIERVWDKTLVENVVAVFLQREKHPLMKKAAKYWM